MSSVKKSKHILILGGMGPQASAYAHAIAIKLAAKYGAHDNEDFPRITHLSINVKDFISSPEYKQEAADYLIECLNQVNLASVDEAFLACNTAHVLLEELHKATRVKFTSMVDETVRVVNGIGGLKKLGILATPSTLNTGLYANAFSETSLQLIEPSAESSQRIEAIIRDVIGGDDQSVLARRLQDEIDTLTADGAEKVILGCTELSLLGSYLEGNETIDPLYITVEKVVS